MKKLVLGLALAFAANAAMAEVEWIDGLMYDLDLQNKTATICGYEQHQPPVELNVSTIEVDGATYTVTAVDRGVFERCDSLKSVSLPNVITIEEESFDLCASLTTVSLPNAVSIGDSSFASCTSLSMVSLPKAISIGVGAFEDCGMKSLVLSWKLLGEIVASRGAISREWGVNDATDVVGPLTEQEIASGVYAFGVKCGGELLSASDYASACAYYRVTPKPEPQVVQEGEVAVKEMELQAAKAEAVSIADGVVSLGVTVNTNGNFTAETKSWAPVELKPENVVVKDGKIVISIPVDSASGFMILQSGDAKVLPAN